MRRMRRRGFSMLELMVVIGIIALISAITLGSFRTVANGNRKTSCQSNMAQIYGAARLYAQDYNGRFPLLNTKADITSGSNTIAQGAGIGLWALYTYSTSFPISADAPKTGYLRSTSVFHCPNDDFTYSFVSPTISTTQVRYNSGSASYLNSSYLSYQSPYNGTATGIQDDATTAPVYSSFRRPANDTGDTSNARRQLVYYTTASGADFSVRPLDTTVVTWCRFHRKLKRAGTDLVDGTTSNTNDANNYDNVLFLDGSVQWMQTKQLITQGGGGSATCIRGWDRLPVQEQNNTAAAPNTFCTGT